MGDTDPIVEFESRVKERLSEEKPWDRVKLFFGRNPITHERYAEAAWSDYASGILAVAAGSYMFTLAGRYGRANYLKANQVTSYYSKLHATRKSTDAYLLYGLKRGLTVTAVSYVGLYAFIGGSQLIELYRCKSNPLHYAAVGSLVGTISRFVYGPRQMVIGAIAGCLVGTAFGAAIVWNQQFFGLTMEERHIQRIRDEFLIGLSPQNVEAIQNSMTSNSSNSKLKKDGS